MNPQFKTILIYWKCVFQQVVEKIRHVTSINRIWNLFPNEVLSNHVPCTRIRFKENGSHFKRVEYLILQMKIFKYSKGTKEFLVRPTSQKFFWENLCQAENSSAPCRRWYFSSLDSTKIYKQVKWIYSN